MEKLRKYSFLTKANFNCYTQLKPALRLTNVDRFAITNTKNIRFISIKLSSINPSYKSVAQFKLYSSADCLF